MAILISDSRNPNYDGNLSTTNGWWVVESSNPSGYGLPALSLSSPRTINLTFANAGNLKGIKVLIQATTRPVALKENVILTFKTTGTVTASAVLTTQDIIKDYPDNRGDISVYAPTFEFDIPVTTTSGIYSVEISNEQGNGGTSNWTIVTSNGTAPLYYAWCDNQATASSGNDTLVISDPIVVDTNFTTKAVLGTGNTTYGASIILTQHTTNHAASAANLRWVNPSAPYTLTIDGVCFCTANAGIRMGTEDSPIPYAQQACIVFLATPTAGSNSGIYNIRNNSNGNIGKGSLQIYGEVPSQNVMRLSADVDINQSTITLTEPPTAWQVGDRVFASYKRNTRTATYTVHTISEIDGNNVTFTSNILSNPLFAGGPVLNLERYGCKLACEDTSYVTNNFQIPSNFVLKGTHLQYFRFITLAQQSGQNYIGQGDYATPYLVEDAVFECDTFAELIGSSLAIPGFGATFNRFYSMGQLARCNFGFSREGALGQLIGSGALKITNCIGNGSRSGDTSVRLTGRFTEFSNNEIYNCSGNLTTTQHSVQVRDFINGIFKNNILWQQNGAVGIFSSIDSTFENNTFDFCINCYNIEGISVGNTERNSQFGQTGSNTFEMYPISNSYIDWLFENCLGTIKVNTADLNDILEKTDGSIKITNDNQVANVDSIYNKNGYFVRTGPGLGDTTTRNGGYALRFESITHTEPLRWTTNIPTGNIQNKSMTVGLWVYINSSNYWNTSHVMPRLTVFYDNNTTTYTETEPVTGWQFINTTFIPSTPYGEILITLSTQTSATGSDAYVYFKDFTGPLPQGSNLNLGEFELWANALPVTPLSLATQVNANDVWAANLSAYAVNQTTAGYAVNQIENKATVSQVGQLLADALNS